VAKSRPTLSGKKQAAMSMAQTRATSKAYRLAYSFVAVLAGFEATPAEEVSHDDFREQRPQQRQQQPQRPTAQQRAVIIDGQATDGAAAASRPSREMADAIKANRERLVWDMGRLERYVIAEINPQGLHKLTAEDAIKLINDLAAMPSGTVDTEAVMEGEFDEHAE
jgi:hypothetical protein